MEDYKAAYRNAVTFHVTDTIRSYELNWHLVSNGEQYPASERCLCR